MKTTTGALHFRSTRFGALGLMFMFTASVGAGDPLPFEAHVSDAIERGVGFLERETSSSLGSTAHSYPLGMRALIAYALLESGVSPSAKGVERLFNEMERLPLTNVYGVALSVMALDARSRALGSEPGSDAKVGRQIARCVEWLIEARLRGKGVWGYQRIPAGATAVRRSVTWVDFSNTQFAALALQVALRWKIEVPERLLREMLAAYEEAATDQVGPSWLRFEGAGWWDDIASAPTSLVGAGASREGQDGDAAGGGTDPLVTADGHTYVLQGVARGWPYRPTWNLPPLERSSATGSMIAAATSSLMVVRSGFNANGNLTPQRRDAIDELIVGGLLSLLALNDLLPLEQDNQWRNYYYTLYSFEKAMDLGGIHLFNEVDWYQKHARVLLGQQKENGAWGRGPNSRAALDPEYELVSTSFALLFLNRATRALRVSPAAPILTGGGSPSSEVERGVTTGRVFLPSRGGMVDLSEIFTALGSLRSAELQKIALEVIDTVPPDELPDLLPYLVSLRHDKRDSVDQFARVQIQRIADLGGDISSADLERWLGQRAALRVWGDECEALRLAEVHAILRDVSCGRVLRQMALVTIQRCGSLESVPVAIELLEDPDAQVRLSAHRALESLTHEKVSFSAASPPEERAVGVERWRSYWARVGADRLAARKWDQLRKQLDRATEEGERQRLRAEIIALGPWVLPHVQAILASSGYAFDWVLVHQALTGRTDGL